LPFINKETMNYFKSFSKELENFDAADFDILALQLFRFQALHNDIYRSYLNHRQVDISAVKNLCQIPYLPISFFKSHKVISGPGEDFVEFFSSSGTTGNITSRHFIWSESFYLDHAVRIFENEYGLLRFSCTGTSSGLFGKKRKFARGYGRPFHQKFRVTPFRVLSL